MSLAFNSENLIKYIKSKMRFVLLISLFASILTAGYLYFFKLEAYSAQVKFYVTNSESIDYNTILDKSFIDLSVEKTDLNRLRSFGYSSGLLRNVIDSIKADNKVSNPTILKKINSENAFNYIAGLYEIALTNLSEIEITVKCDDKKFAYYLCHQIMEGMNDMNNRFLSSFKQEQIEARERQILLLEEEKKILFEKINTASKKFNEETNTRVFSRFSNYEDLEKLILQQNSPERLELSLNIQKINSLSDNIEGFKRALYNDRLSLEMLKKKKPYLTQDRPAKNNINLYSIFIIFVFSFLSFAFFVIFILALGLRYQKHLKLMVS